MNYSFLKKFLMLSAIVTSSVSNYSSATAYQQSQKYDSDIIGIRSGSNVFIKKAYSNNKYDLNSFKYNYNDGYEENINDNVKNNPFIFKFDQKKYTNNNQQSSQVNLTELLEVVKNNFLDTIGNNNVLLQQLGGNQNLYGINALNSAIQNKVQQIMGDNTVNVNNNVNPSIKLLATFLVMADAKDKTTDKKLAATNNCGSFFFTLLGAANKMSSNSEVVQLLQDKVKFGTNSGLLSEMGSFLFTLTSIFEKSDIKAGDNDIETLNSIFGSKSTLTRNSKILLDDSVFGSKLSDDTKLLLSNENFFKDRRVNLNKLLEECAKNTTISDSEYVLLLTHEIFHVGNEEKLANFINNNKKQFSSAADLAVALSNILYPNEFNKEVGGNGGEEPGDNEDYSMLTEAEAAFMREVKAGKNQYLTSDGQKRQIGKPYAKALKEYNSLKKKMLGE